MSALLSHQDTIAMKPLEPRLSVLQPMVFVLITWNTPGGQLLCNFDDHVIARFRIASRACWWLK
jgi:hypothetical protein